MVHRFEHIFNYFSYVTSGLYVRLPNNLTAKLKPFVAKCQRCKIFPNHKVWAILLLDVIHVHVTASSGESRFLELLPKRFFIGWILGSNPNYRSGSYGSWHNNFSHFVQATLYKQLPPRSSEFFFLTFFSLNLCLRDLLTGWEGEKQSGF